MSPRDTISLAHTARCKLMIAADKPDRNLRFILGHAFTLDKLRLRLLEIEQDSDNISDSTSSEDLPVIAGPRRVSFSQSNLSPNNATKTRYRSPPPGADAHVDTAVEEEEDENEDEDEIIEEDDEEDEGLSLQRFSSASEQPPRMIADEGSDEEEDEAVSPTQMPSEMELRSITTGAVDDELADLYKTVKGCPCHGEHKHAPDVTKAWEVPQKEGYQGKRLAIVEVAA